MTAAKVMFAPVLAASLTTIAAFFPILTIGKEIGNIIQTNNFISKTVGYKKS